MAEIFKNIPEGMMWAYLTEAVELNQSRLHLLRNADFRHRGTDEETLLRIGAEILKRDRDELLKLSFHYYERSKI